MSFLPPPAAGGSSSERYWSPNKNIADNGTEYLRLCGTYATGHGARGFRYWTNENRPVYCAEWPNETPNIKMRPSKADPNVLQADAITEVLLLVGFVAGAGGFRLLEISQRSIRLELETVASRSDCSFTSDGLADWVLKVEKNLRINPSLPTYIATIIPEKPPSDEMADAWSAFAPTVQPGLRFAGQNPFVGATPNLPDGTYGEDPSPAEDLPDGI